MREPIITESAVLLAALDYAGRGWNVFPVHSIADGRCTCGNDTCNDQGKHPRTPHGFHDATTDESSIRGWWSTWPEANIGIATGAASGFDALDVDAGHGGFASLDTLKERVGPLPTTLAVRTGSGGLHLYFAHADHVRNTTRLNGLGGLDVRGDGGYVVAPPSVHASGGHYMWTVARTTPIAAWTDALLALVSRNGHVQRTPVTGDDCPAVVHEGARNNTLTQWAGALRHVGTPLEAIETALQRSINRRAVPHCPRRRCARSRGRCADIRPPRPGHGSPCDGLATSKRRPSSGISRR